MAGRRKKRVFPVPEIQGIVHEFCLDQAAKTILGLGSIMLGFAALKYAAPRTVETLIPLIISAWTPKGSRAPAFVHPEAAEPIRTEIDERQLGRSEVFRAVARPEQN
jgi:hypothetical protein